MDSTTVVALLHCFLFASLVQSAPISSPAFKAAAERAKTLVEKILRDIPAAHSASVSTEGFTLDPSSQISNLQLMVTSMGIPAAPVLKPLSGRFTPDTCVSHMSAGSQLYQELLGVLSGKLSGLEDLRADLRDLLTHINKLKELGELGADASDRTPRLDLAPHLQDSYTVQVLVHVTLTQLRSFCHDLTRSLRALATYRP
ncbi:colony stimulating factor 3 (granulocyte) b [Odontesthes bonariensis]|uniref:colony stimulating factor 3 (granulocyte) b n=1 Tax=Odontesthes bonariensis TaxID=219752 RepID=UPI003F587C7F